MYKIDVLSRPKVIHYLMRTLTWTLIDNFSLFIGLGMGVENFNMVPNNVIRFFKSKENPSGQNTVVLLLGLWSWSMVP